MILFILLLMNNILGIEVHESSQFEKIKISPDKTIRLNNWKIMLADHPEYAFKSHPDSTWPSPNLRDPVINEYGDAKWMRKSIRIDNHSNEFDYLVLDIIGLYNAYEVYWDGKMIYHSGQVADANSEEVQGNNHSKINIPRELATPDNHVIAIRVSNKEYQNSFAPYFRVKFGFNETLLSEQNNYVTKQVLKASVFFVTALFCFGLFVGSNRKRPYLIFATLWTVYLIEIIITTTSLTSQEVTFFSYYLVDWIKAFSFIELASIGFFIIYIFRYNRHYWLLGATTILAVLTTYGSLPFTFNISYISSMLIVIYAIVENKKGSILILIGMLTHLALSYSEAYGIVQFGDTIGHVLLVSFVLVAIAQRLKIQTTLYQDSMLRSARLELELLKMNIKPHFLLNTLFSVMSWMEESPKVAKKIIKSLSEEFRLISKISSEKTISIREELELCEYHLELMGYRKNAKYRLNYHNIDETERVPPMIFHTLIENGLTHSFLSNEDGEFDLFYEKNGNHKTYKMVNSGSQIKEATDEEIKEGIGLKYVKSRLDEAFTDRWKMIYGKHDDRWEVEIVIQG